MANLHFTLLVIVAALLVLPGLARVSMHAALRKALFDNYDKLSKPEGQTNVTVGLHLLDLDLCPRKQILSSNGYSSFMWNDDRLSWDPKEWGGMDSLRVPATEVWLPDITVFNVAGKIKTNYYDYAETTNAVVMASGYIIHTPPVKYKSFCTVNYDNWPVGEQNCTLAIGSWTYDQNEVNIQPSSPDAINIENFQNNQIKILDTNYFVEEKTYPCCPDDVYPKMHLSFAFKRTTMFHHNALYKPKNV